MYAAGSFFAHHGHDRQPLVAGTVAIENRFLPAVGGGVDIPAGFVGVIAYTKIVGTSISSSSI